MWNMKMLSASGPIAYGIAAENMPQKNLKVCFLGKYHVGKTSITTRFVKGRFDEEYKATFGAAFMSRSLYFHNVEYRFALWDTAGQERFRSLAPLTYKSASAALVVYDITNQESFEEVNFWMSELRRQGPEGILIYMVGNKIDLESDRIVDRELAEKYAKTKGAFHFQTSAKNGEGIDEIFKHICQMELSTSSMRENGRLHRRSVVDVTRSMNNDQGITDRERRCRCSNT